MSDSEIILSRREPDAGWPDGGVKRDVLGYFDDCARGPSCVDLLFGDDRSLISECVGECIDTTDITALSTGCRGCYMNQVLCVLDHCVAPCVSGTDSTCSDCVSLNCNDDVFACRGFE